MCTEMSSKRGGVETDIRLIASTFIKSLKHEVVPAKRRRNVECPICLETRAVASVRELPCGHVFHRECIDKWNQISRTCPVCRDTSCVHATAQDAEKKRKRRRNCNVCDGGQDVYGDVVVSHVRHEVGHSDQHHQR